MEVVIILLSQSSLCAFSVFKSLNFHISIINSFFLKTFPYSFSMEYKSSVDDYLKYSTLVLF